MNVSHLKIILLRMVLLVSPLLMSAQGSISYKVISGTPYQAIENVVLDPVPLTYRISPNNPFYRSAQELGDISYKFSNGTLAINYTPYGMVGRDTMVFEFAPSFTGLGQKIYRGLIIDLHTKVKANSDYALTEVNKSVVIDVLANDVTEGGMFKNISSLPLINNGTATIENGKIRFTPEKDFTGLAYFNYTVCDEFGTCSTANVTITVAGTPLNPYEELNLITVKNRSIPLVLPSDKYAVYAAASSGTVSNVGGNVWQYVPNTNYYGKDKVIFRFEQGGKTYQATVNIEVLNVADPNVYAKEDVIYTAINTNKSFNVLTNDSGANKSVLSNTQPSSGTLTAQGNGDYLYVPVAGFTGVVNFSYTALIDGKTETATVFIVVSNLAPAYSIYNLTTAKNTPLVLNYNVPIIGFNFDVVNGGTNGETSAYMGDNIKIQLGNVTISGSNLLIYQPNTNYLGDDEVELNYVINNTAKTVKLRIKVVAIPSAPEPYCVNDCVWPGDGNNDGVVDMRDLLMLGYYIGERGKSRQIPFQSLEKWYGQYSENWNQVQSRSINSGYTQDIKYVDMDGSGAIDATDTTAITRYYGKMHNILSDQSISLKDLKLYPVLITPDVQPGDMAEIELYLGNDDFPALDLYGFTFNFLYGSRIKPGSVKVEIYKNSWFTYNSPILSLMKEPYTGSVDVGFTRTAQTTVSGKGKIGKLRVVIDDDVNGFKDDEENQSVALRFGAANMVTGSGHEFAIATQDLKIPIKNTKKQATLDESQVMAYPNPANNVINLYLNGGQDIQSAQLMNVAGQIMDSKEVQNRQTAFNMSNLAEGVYLVKIITAQGAVTKRIVKTAN